MTCKASGGNLAIIPWEPPAITELPKVIEGDPDAWVLWDAAVIEQDRNTPDGRAYRLAHMEKS